jgi:hypothetical protein
MTARYRERSVELHYRADAAFAKPEVYEFWRDRISGTRSGSRPTRCCRGGSSTC